MKRCSDIYTRIKKSEFFVVLGCHDYFESVGASLESNIAKELNKPFRILLYPNVSIPPNFIAGVSDCKEAVFDMNVDLDNQIALLCGIEKETIAAVDGYEYKT